MEAASCREFMEDLGIAKVMGSDSIKTEKHQEFYSDLKIWQKAMLASLLLSLSLFGSLCAEIPKPARMTVAVLSPLQPLAQKAGA